MDDELKDGYKKQIEYIKKKHAKYVKVFGNDDAQELLDELADEYYINRSTVIPSGTIDPYVSAVREGQRSVILKLRNMSNKELISKQLKQMEEGMV
jgi:hypothetical protein